MTEFSDRPVGLPLGPGSAGSWDDDRVSEPRLLHCPDGLRQMRLRIYGRSVRTALAVVGISRRYG
jgi:hypothetical protein